MINNFVPDYRNILKVLFNERPARLPLYEHHIDAPFISKPPRFWNRTSKQITLGCHMQSEQSPARPWRIYSITKFGLGYSLKFQVDAHRDTV